MLNFNDDYFKTSLHFQNISALVGNKLRMNKTTILFSIILCGLLTSCFDLYTRHYEIDGPYFVESDPAADCKTLYYDLGDGNAIERVRDIKRAGHTDKFIIVEGQDGYYFIDRKKDNKFLNGSEIIGCKKSHEYFLNWLDSLKIINFKFDYYLKK